MDGDENSVPKILLGISSLLTSLEARESFPIPKERLCSHFQQIPKSDSIHHMSRSKMRPELPPLPASANEEPSEVYQVCSPGGPWGTGRQAWQWDWWLWSFK